MGASSDSTTWSQEQAQEWLENHSAYFAAMQNRENREALSILVAKIKNQYGLLPDSGAGRTRGGSEPNLKYSPGFVSFELRKSTSGFRLLVRGARDQYEGIVPPEYFVATRPPSLRMDFRDPLASLDTAWAAIQRSAAISKLASNPEGELDSLLSRITFDPDKCGGRPCVRHMRIRVTDVLEMLAGGAPAEEILEDYPYLEPEDLRACLAFAARWLDHPVLRAS
jgi:uncharacterized protein (DUF433 family)